MSKQIETAEQAIHDRFVAIEAALEDLRPRTFGILKRHVVDGNESLLARYQNRLMSVFLLISHLRDDVKRLTNRRGLKKTAVDDFVKTSLPVSLCVRAGDTTKHGLGGRSKNATIANGLIAVYKTPTGRQPSSDDDCIIIGMVLVDGKHGVFHSNVVIDKALNAWVAFLASQLGLDFHGWLRRCLPEAAKQVIHIKQDEHVTVPEGATLVAAFPAELSSALVDDVRKRSLDI